MEPELLTRNYQPPPPLKQKVGEYIKSLWQRNKNIADKLKNPKILTIIVLVLILLVVFLAVLALTGNRKTAPPYQPNMPVISQTVTPTPLPKLSEIDIQVEDFNKQLEDNQPYFVKLKQPIVDLDLSYKK